MFRNLPARPTRCLLALVALASPACAPSDNWRDLQWSQGQVAAQFPCKPDLVERAQAALVWCEHRDASLSLAWQVAPGPEQARTVLNGIVERFGRQTGVMPERGDGAMPQGALAWPESGRYVWRHPDGAVHALVWARGLTVYQATVLVRAPAPSGETLVAPFFSGIRSLP